MTTPPTKQQVDALIGQTEKLVKLSVLTKVQRAIRDQQFEKLRIAEVLVKETTTKLEDDAWKAILICAPTQAGKSWKFFDVLSKKLVKYDPDETNLVLFVSQANCTMSANQIVQRARANSALTQYIPADCIMRSSNVPDAESVACNSYMIVDFWNSKCMVKMQEFVKNTADKWSRVIIVVDECEQGAVAGIRPRLNFIKKIERSLGADVPIKLIFITATVANLSKSIYKIAKTDTANASQPASIIGEIIHNRVVEHYFAEPHPTYVGPNWFQEQEGIWKKLVFPARDAGQTKAEYQEIRDDKIVSQLNCLSHAQKELSLIVTSTRKADHSAMAERLYRIGYNVIVELNGTNIKNYIVKYVARNGKVASWVIPYSNIEAAADRGELSECCIDRQRYETGIFSKNDITLAHVLQAALFMMTNAEGRIKRNVAGAEEFRKLVAIEDCISHLETAKRRPKDFPVAPRVALIAGHLAGRGITIQNPFIDFTCTSFCFTDTRDVAQRGATNAQRFGRACGMLAEIYATRGQKPALIATEAIMRDAVANERALVEKSATIENGSLVSLKDLIPKEFWDRVVKSVKRELKRAGQDGSITQIAREEAVDRIINLVTHAPDNSVNFAWTHLDKVDKVLSNYLRKCHNRVLNELVVEGRLEKNQRSWFKLKV